VLHSAAEAAGPGRVTRHQFRHIHSSLLNDLNVPVKIAQEQIGHASVSTTLNICTHAVDASHRKAIEGSNANCSSFWTTVDYKRRPGWKTPRPQATPLPPSNETEGTIRVVTHVAHDRVTMPVGLA